MAVADTNISMSQARTRTILYEKPVGRSEVCMRETLAVCRLAHHLYASLCGGRMRRGGRYITSIAVADI